MNITYSDDIIRVVVLDVSGIYAQIFDEIYCKESEYSAFHRNIKSLKFNT